MTRPIVIRGDARRLPLPDESVDLIITSPPYFALRSYTDNGAHYAGQIGSEPTPAEYIAALVDCTREWMRVLKKDGSAFINLGDKYSGAQAQNIAGANRAGNSARTWQQTDPHRTGIPNKSLMLLPERYRVACVDQLGLIARAVIVWAKPNGLPESVTDRVRRSHEDWVHLTQSPRYFAAVDEVRERTDPAVDRHVAKYNGRDYGKTNAARGDLGASNFVGNPLGKLPGSVWEVATEPLQVPADVAVEHFAAFPSEWPRRLILGWSPSGICTACDQGRRPVVHSPATPRVHKDTKFLHDRRTDAKPGSLNDGFDMSGAEWTRWRRENPTTITGYACACTPYTDHPGTGESSGPSFAAALAAGSYVTKGIGGEKSNLSDRPKVGPWREYHFDRWTPPPTRPSVILDPFGGTGTVSHVAAALGRIGISLDLSGDYSRLAAHPELADRRRRKVLGLDKPVLPVVPAGQLGFDWEDVS